MPADRDERDGRFAAIVFAGGILLLVAVGVVFVIGFVVKAFRH